MSIFWLVENGLEGFSGGKVFIVVFCWEPSPYMLDYKGLIGRERLRSRLFSTLLRCSITTA